MSQYRQDTRSANTTPATPNDRANVRLFPEDSMVVPAKNASELEMASADASASEVLVDTFAALGVEHAFTVFGGAIAPFCRALSRSSIRIVHCRHETGAAFAAIEASLASGKPSVVVSTAGPGLTNLITGMVAARWEGAQVIFVSGCTAPPNRGKWAFQECGGPGAPQVDLYQPGPLFHFAQILVDGNELPTVVSRLRSGVAKPNGFVAHLGVPVSLQVARVKALASSSLRSVPPRHFDPAIAHECARDLSDENFVIWAGSGARHAARELRELAERAQSMVICSPRGKGIFPENDPLFLGVTGLGGYGAIDDYFRVARPARLLVLGSRLGEMTSFWDERLTPSRELIHVDLDTEVFGTAYPGVPTVGIQAEVGAFLRALLDAWPDRSRTECVMPVRTSTQVMEAPRSQGAVRPSFLMQAIQCEVVEGSSAIVLTEAGNSFSLGTHYLRFSEPRRYRVSTGFGSMGHACAGVVGATLGTRQKAVAIVGDGAMLMQNELSTAATYGIPALWIVLNDARYGMIAQGMESLGWEPFETDFARADFVGIARSMGADGIRVEREVDVVEAIRLGMRAAGPFVIDVMVDPSELAPSGKRNQSLRAQGVGKGR